MPTNKKPAHRNIAVVVGAVARDPEVRELADGTTVVELDLKVSVEGSPSSTVPVSWPSASDPGLAAGSEVLVVGRVRRRFYRTGGGTVSRTDLLADLVVATTPTKRAAAALAAAAEQIVA